MKKRLFLLSVTAVFLLALFGCSLIGGLLMNDEEKAFIGLWRSSGWDDSSETCYYDFRDNGRVFVTDWTDDLETTNNIVVPNYFNYSVKDNTLKMSQILGIIKFEFNLIEDSYLDGEAWYLYVNNESFDYWELELGNSLYLQKVADYTYEARTVRTFMEGFDYE